MPEHLLIVLNRFTLNGQRITTHVLPNDALMVGEDSFQLKAVTEHIGASSTTGHYIVHVKLDEGWFECNDSLVTAGLTDGRAKSRNAVGFLYSKVDVPEIENITLSMNVTEYEREKQKDKREHEDYQSVLHEKHQKYRMEGKITPSFCQPDMSIESDLGNLTKKIRGKNIEATYKRHGDSRREENITHPSGQEDPRDIHERNIFQTENSSSGVESDDNLEVPPEVSQDIFHYNSGGVTFKEVENNLIECGACGKCFVRIGSHLKNKKTKCCIGLDLKAFNTALNKFRQKRKYLNLKNSNSEHFRKNQQERRRKCDKHLKEKDPEQFCKNQQERQNIFKEKDPENQQKRQKKCDKLMKEKDPEQFGEN